MMYFRGSGMLGYNFFNELKHYDKYLGTVFKEVSVDDEVIKTMQ